ncbi:hypothetical protein A3K64_01200 [Candidatus Micrarchaeota archaeon RBG_16_36_9]|nr:MAG: hypothetical protein A3K64_01200 [Candidatus Micrarchaeota archaeon RBG_16_36_9]
MIVMSEERIHTGIRPLNEALNSISIGRSDGRSGRSRSASTYTTIKEQEYNRVRLWMKKYSIRLVFDDSGNVTGASGKPVLPTEEEMKRDLGITCGRFNAIAKNNDDIGIAFHYNTDISKEMKRQMDGTLGLRTGVTYVALESQYPFLSKVFEKK